MTADGVVLLNWEKEGEYWTVKASFSGPTVRDDEMRWSTATSRRWDSAVTYALEELAKSIRETPR